MLSIVGLVPKSSVVAQESQELRSEIVGSKEADGGMRVESTLCDSLCVLAWDKAIAFLQGGQISPLYLFVQR